MWDERHHCLCWRGLSGRQVEISLEEEIGFPQILIPNFQHSCIWVEGRSNFGTRASSKSSRQRGLCLDSLLGQGSKNNSFAFVAGDGAVAAEFWRPSFCADRSTWSGQARLDDWLKLTFVFHLWILSFKEVVLLSDSENSRFYQRMRPCVHACVGTILIASTFACFDLLKNQKHIVISGGVTCYVWATKDEVKRPEGLPVGSQGPLTSSCLIWSEDCQRDIFPWICMRLLSCN